MGQMKTNSNVTIIPSTGVISCGGLNTSGSSGYTAYTSSNAGGTYGTATGQIGNIVSGAIYLTPLANSNATIIISVITLSAGVWLITGSIQGSNSSLTQYKVCLSITAGSGGTGSGGTLNNNNQSSIITPVCTSVTGVALNCNTVVCITSPTQYNLVVYLQTATFTIANGQYTAVRIA